MILPSLSAIGRAYKGPTHTSPKALPPQTKSPQGLYVVRVLGVYFYLLSNTSDVRTADALVEDCRIGESECELRRGR